MPAVVIHKFGQTFRGEVTPNSNLVVRTGIKQFPWPHLEFGCGMGKCAKCACQVLEGAHHLPAPNWKEKKMLGDRLDQGWRLMCQLWIEHDLEILQPDHPVDARPTASPAKNAPASSTRD